VVLIEAASSQTTSKNLTSAATYLELNQTKYIHRKIEASNKIYQPLQTAY